MASTIVTKNSSTASAVPLTGDLTQGELAVNVTDKRLFTKDSGGTVVELGINPSSLTVKTTLKLSGSSSGYVALQGAAAAGSTTYTLPSADGTNGQALTTNGSGTLAWATISTAAATPTVLGTVYGKMTASGASPFLTALGYNAASVNTGTYSTAVGYNALYNGTSGTYNTALGAQAINGGGTGVTGSNNVGVGNLSLSALTSGGNNVAVGRDALTSNTTASNNTAVGYQALYSNTVSNGNVAVGYQALYNSNRTADTDNYSVAVGYQALLSATTGANSTAVGREALRSITTAGSSCAFGRNALYSDTVGNNSAFGYAVGKNITSGTYNCWFGYDMPGSNSTTGSFNTGMGYQVLYSLTSGSSNTCYGLYAGYALTSGSSNIFIGQDAGRSGSPGGLFTTENNRVVMGNGNITNAYIQVSWTVTSDARDKTDVVDSKYGLEFVKGMRPVEFKWDKRSNYFNGKPDGTHKEAKTQIGFLAQDVIALEKQHGAVAKDLLIADDEKEEEIVSITETKMIPVLVKALQELNAKFDQLKAEHDAYVASHP